VLSDINLTIPAGTVVGVIGGTGSSTFMMKIYYPSAMKARSKI